MGQAFEQFRKEIASVMGEDSLRARYASILLRVWERRQKLFEKYAQFLPLRSEYIHNLANLIHESIVVQAQSFGEWRTREFVSDDLDHALLVSYAPQLYYKVLNCEIVFDIESLDDKNLRKCLSVLSSFKIEPIVAFSGNRGYHIHVFLTPQNLTINKFVGHPQAKEFTIEIFKFLKEIMTDKGVEEIDCQVKCGHWIRCLYSLNVKNGKVGLKKTISGEIKVWEVPLALIETLKLRHKFKKELEEILRDEEERFEWAFDSSTLSKALKALEPFKAREYSHYIAYHCPFHPPDKNPSFTFWKKAGIFKDWHDGKTYNAFTLLKTLKRGEEK
ncbi:MAG: hypothetical protein QXG39_08855 [Candidatus Aenigmatarchaeota archaeon]